MQELVHESVCHADLQVLSHRHLLVTKDELFWKGGICVNLELAERTNGS